MIRWIYQDLEITILADFDHIHASVLLGKDGPGDLPNPMHHSPILITMPSGSIIF